MIPRPNKRKQQAAENRELKEREVWAKEFYLRHVPKGVVEMLTGRQNKVLGDWVTHYDAPLAEESVDLYQLLKWFADRLAKYGRFEKTLADDADDDGEDDGDGDGNLQANYIKAKTIKATEDTLMQRVKREKLQEELVIKEIIHAALARLSDRLRAAGERCRARWGDDAVALFDDLQAGFALDIDAVCSDQELAESEQPDATAGADGSAQVAGH